MHYKKQVDYYNKKVNNTLTKGIPVVLPKQGG